MGRPEPPALTGDILPSMDRDRGWAGLRAAARPCQQRGAEQSQLGGAGAGGVWRAGSYVSASARSKPVGPAARLQRLRFPNCSRHSLQNTCPVRPARGCGAGPEGPGESASCEQGRPGPREQQHAGIPCCSSGCLPTQAPLPPLCAPHSRTHSSPAQPSTEEGMHSHAQPQGSLSGVTQKSGVPCSKGKKMLFPPNFSGGLFIPLLTELLC